MNMISIFFEHKETEEFKKYYDMHANILPNYLYFDFCLTFGLLNPYSLIHSNIFDIIKYVNVLLTAIIVPSITKF